MLAVIVLAVLVALAILLSIAPIRLKSFNQPAINTTSANISNTTSSIQQNTTIAPTTTIPQQGISASNATQIPINATILDYIQYQLSSFNTTSIGNQSNTTELNATHALNASQISAIDSSINELIANISNSTNTTSTSISTTANSTSTSITTSTIMANTTTILPTNATSTTSTNTTTIVPTNTSNSSIIAGNWNTLISANVSSFVQPERPPVQPAETTGVKLTQVQMDVTQPASNDTNIPEIFTKTFNISYGDVSQDRDAVAANRTLEYISVKNGSVSDNMTIRPSITILKYRVQKSARYLHLKVLGYDITGSGNYTVPAPSPNYTISPQFLSLPIAGNHFNYVYSISFSNGTKIASNSINSAQSIDTQFSNIRVDSQTVTIKFDAVSLNGNYIGIDPTLTITPSPPIFSNTVIDVGQISVINTIVSGGINGYTSNWFWIAPNVMAGSLIHGNTIPTTTSNAYPGNNIEIIVNAVTSNQLILTTLTNTIQNTLLTTTANNALGLWNFNALVIDSNGVGANTLTTANVPITIDSAPGIPTVTVSNTLPDSGEWKTFNIVESGGTPPYQAGLYNVTNLPTNEPMAGVFNGISGRIQTAATMTVPSSGTISEWVLLSVIPASGYPTIGGYIQAADPEINLVSGTGVPYLGGGIGSATASTALSLNKWTFLTATWSFSGGITTAQMYVNGVASGSPGTGSGSVSGTDGFRIGEAPFNGLIADVQTYNAALSPAQISGLYANGISAPPISTLASNVVGWWPINGNANDLSGNGNNGISTYVVPYVIRPSYVTSIYTSGGSNTISFQTNSPANSNTFSFNVIVMDSATTPISSASVENSFTVNTAPSITSLSVSNSLANSGQWETFSVGSVSGGTPPYQAGLYNVTNLPANEPMAAFFGNPGGGMGSNYISTSFLPTNGLFTISVWILPGAQKGGADAFLSDEVYGTSGFRFGLQGTSICFWTGQSGGTINACAGNKPANVWYHLVVTYGNQQVSLYLNGVNVYSGSGTYLSPTQPLNIGFVGGGAFNGSVADVQVYNAVLTAAQVSALYANGLSAKPILPSNIIGWWLLNGNANDLSGYNNNGIWLGTTAYAVRPSYVTSIYTSGGSNTISFQANSPTNSNTFLFNAIVTDSAIISDSSAPVENSFTVNAGPSSITSLSVSNSLADSGQWETFLTTVNGGTAPFQIDLYNVTNLPTNEPMAGVFNGISSNIITGTTLLPLGDNPRSAFAWVYYTGPSNAPNFYGIYGYGPHVAYEWSDLAIGYGAGVYFSGASDDCSHFSSATMLNTWQFVGYTYSAGASNALTIYLDGRSVTCTLATALNTILPGSLASTIGDTSGASPSYFPGSIADVQVYNAVLSAAQVSALYANGLSATPILTANIVGWWPLNGNANDLSGNGNNGIATNVIYAVRPSYVNWIYSQGGSNTISFQTNSPTNGNTFSFNAIVMSNATTPSITNSVTNSFTVNMALASPLISQSVYPTITNGQVEVFNAFSTGGTPPYTTYNFIVYNSVTNAPLANMLTPSNSFLWTITGTNIGNTFEANVIVTDSATTRSSMISGNTPKVTIKVPYNAPSNPTLTLSNTLIDQGQSILFNAGLTNGNQLFSYNYLIVNSITNIPIANQLYTNVQSNSNSFLWTPPPNLYTANTFEANVVMTEQGAYGNTVNTIYYTIGYNAYPTVSLFPSNSLTASGRYETYNVIANGGTFPSNGYQAGLYNVTNTLAIPQAAVFINPGGGLGANFVTTSYTGTNGLFTISAWLLPGSQNGGYGVALSEDGYLVSGFRFGIQGTEFCFWTIQDAGTITGCSGSKPLNAWYHFVAVYGNQQLSLYLNGVNVYNGSGTYISPTVPLTIGRAGGAAFNGSVADVQVYNAALSAAQVSALYANGLSATPILPANIVGWWPLNGNANDLSGYNNNGIWSGTIEYAPRPSYVTSIYISGGSNTISFQTNSPTNSNTFSFNAIITDSATTPVTANSITNSIKVWTSLPLTPTISPATTSTYSVNQIIKIASYESGGTGVYTYNFILFNNVTNIIIANQLSASNTFTLAANTFMVGNTYQANVITTDTYTGLSSNYITNSINSGFVEVYQGALTANPNPPLVSNSFIDIGQYSTINTIINNGTAPYTGYWMWTPPNTIIGSPNTITANILNGMLINAVMKMQAVSATNVIMTYNGMNYYITPLGTNQLVGKWTLGFYPFDMNGNYIITSANSVTISPALIVVTPTASNNPVDNDHVHTTLTAHPSGGSLPYSYQWFAGTNTICNNDLSITNATSSTYIASPNAPTYYCYRVTDNGTSAQSGYSNALEVGYSIVNTVYDSINSSFFGISTGNKYSYVANGELTDTMGAPTIKFGTAGKNEGYVTWNAIEPQFNVYNWSFADAYVAAAEADGAGNSIIIGDFGTPGWAIANGYPSNSCGNYTYDSCVPPNMIYYDNYITNLTTRYAGRVKYFVIWNEVSDQASWLGTVQQMLNITASTYNIIHNTDPSAEIISPTVEPGGISVPPPCTSSGCWMATFLEDGGGQYINVIGWHGYPSYINSTSCFVNNLLPTNDLPCAGQALISNINLLRSYANQSGINKPIIDEEGGWGQNLGMNGTAQAAYISRWYTVQASEGILTAVFWIWGPYEANVSTSYGSGISNPIPVTAYNQTYKWLVGATMQGPCYDNYTAAANGIWECRLSNPSLNEGNVMIVWSNSTLLSTPFTPSSQYKYYTTLSRTVNSISGAIPTTYSPILLYQQPSVPSPILTPSNAIIGQGQGALLTANIAGTNLLNGVPPYTYNFQVFNSTGLVFNGLYANVYQTSNLFKFTPLALGTYYANVVVTDSATVPVTENSVNSIITVKNTTLSATVSNPGNVGYYTIAVVTFNGVRAIRNQTQWSLYVNGKLYGITNSLISWSEQAQSGTYSFVFSNPGDANYTNYTTTATLNVQGITTGGSPGISTPTIPTATSTIPTTSNTTATTPTSTTTVPIPYISSFDLLIVNNSNLTVKNTSSGGIGTKFSVINNTFNLPPPPQGFGSLYAINVNSTFTVPSAISLTTNYQCGISSNLVKPFLLSNNTWLEISPYSINQSQICTLTFNAPSTSKIGVFVGSGSVTITTVEPSTTIVPAIIQQSGLLGPEETTIIAIAAIVVVGVVICALIFLLRLKPRR
jgi:hypothetical protein